jgi:hypothetical protein
MRCQVTSPQVPVLTTTTTCVAREAGTCGAGESRNDLLGRNLRYQQQLLGRVVLREQLRAKLLRAGPSAQKRGTVGIICQLREDALLTNKEV